MDQMAYQCLWNRRIDSIHRHMVSVISRPSKSKFRHISCTNYNSTGLIGNIHQYLCSFSCLGIFIDYTVIFRIMSDIFKMLLYCCPHRNLTQCCSQFQ